MRVVLKNVAKRFGRHSVIKSFTQTFNENESWAVRGKNGSGKSTLLRLVSGSMMPGKGSIEYFMNTKPIDPDNLYKYISIATPYMDLVEELTFEEHITFHASFKPFIKGISKEQIIDLSGLKKHKNKTIKVYSSGMKQRARLVLAILSDTPLLLLDEPSSNLDKEGVAWYNSLAEDYIKDRTVLVFSNYREDEYSFCKNTLDIDT